jgi:hypothetical protein
VFVIFSITYYWHTIILVAKLPTLFQRDFKHHVRPSSFIEILLQIVWKLVKPIVFLQYDICTKSCYMKSKRSTHMQLWNTKKMCNVQSNHYQGLSYYAHGYCSPLNIYSEKLSYTAQRYFAQWRHAYGICILCYGVVNVQLSICTCTILLWSNGTHILDMIYFTNLYYYPHISCSPHH